MTSTDLLRAAKHALRSYQYGNAAPDLAASVADRIDAALELVDAPPEPAEDGPSEPGQPRTIDNDEQFEAAPNVDFGRDEPLAMTHRYLEVIDAAVEIAVRRNAERVSTLELLEAIGSNDECTAIHVFTLLGIKPKEFGAVCESLRARKEQ